jgi:hypothetical protein
LSRVRCLPLPVQWYEVFMISLSIASLSHIEDLDCDNGSCSIMGNRMPSFKEIEEGEASLGRYKWTESYEK